MSKETIARRYASALADVVLKRGDAENVKTELAIFEQMIAANGDLGNVLANPAIPHSKKERVLEQVVAKTKPSKTTGNFLRVLLQNGRLIDLAEINVRF